uniref:Ankyrin repeat protein n=1 Tax=Moumouvirus sp. 'Monve' TaxID=1128131 RepID=H2EDG5_9VIRU|nr:hypothetical protein mv_L233 [Moumouvirus Monve]
MSSDLSNNIKNIIVKNDLDKYREILSSKLNESDSYDVLNKTLKYGTSCFHNILFDAIIDGNIYMDKTSIEIISSHESIDFTKKLITSDCLSIKLEYELLSYFVFNENVEIIELLFKKGLDPNYKNGKLFRSACSSRNEKN